MKTNIHKHRRIFPATVLAGLVFTLLLGLLPARLPAQSPPRIFNPPPGAGNSSTPPRPDAPGKGGGPWIPSAPLTAGSDTNDADGDTNKIQLSFQGANIDMVVQWLSQTTGKSVVKHPQVQCQLTITSSRKVTKREAINLVYRALALEGFSAIEFSDSILIVPQDKEPKMTPELLGDSQTNVPEGRQWLVKVFSLKHAQASDVKDRISTALSDKATVYVDEAANQIVIADYNDNLRAVGELIAALDTDQPEDVTVRTIPLKHVSAADLVKEIGPLYQKKNGKSLKDTVEVSADEQSNTLLILASAANFKVIQQFVSSLDTEEAQDKIMRTFTLKNADAQDVAKQLQDLNQEQNVTARYIYNFSAQNDKSAKKMTVVADRRRNAVIVQAPPAQMDGIESMIAELDAPVNDDSLAPKIYPMKYASASDIEDVLNELFLKKQPQRSYYDFFSDFSDSSSTPDRDVGRLYGKVRITSEPNSNALIVTANSKENLAAVEEIINQLDKPPEAGESTLHVGLKFAKAIDVANSINVLFARNGSPPLRAVAQPNQPNNGNPQPNQQQQTGSSSESTGFDLGVETKIDGYFPWLGGQIDNSRSGDSKAARPVSDLVGRIRAVADERSNALMISANVHFFPQILKLIAALDAPTDQVLIEARLVEVSSDFLDQLGVRWSPDGSQVFTANDLDNSLIANVSSKYQQGYGGKTAVNPSPDAISQALTSLRSGVLSSSISMDFLVQFLHKTTDANVLAAPQLNIRDNETGKLFVGQQVPVPDDTLTSSQLGGQSTTIKYKDVGVVLEVSPHINSAGDVELKIHAESSTVVPGQTVLGGAVFDTRNFRTDLTAKNGQTLVVGGIIQKQLSNINRKTPGLGSIPILKWFVNSKNNTTHEVELMVFLRPKVIRTPEDAQDALREVNQKTPLIQKWQAETNAPDVETNPKDDRDSE